MSFDPREMVDNYSFLVDPVKSKIIDQTEVARNVLHELQPADGRSTPDKLQPGRGIEQMFSLG